MLHNRLIRSAVISGALVVGVTTMALQAGVAGAVQATASQMNQAGCTYNGADPVCNGDFLNPDGGPGSAATLAGDAINEVSGYVGLQFAATWAATGHQETSPEFRIFNANQPGYSKALWYTQVLPVTPHEAAEGYQYTITVGIPWHGLVADYNSEEMHFGYTTVTSQSTQEGVFYANFLVGAGRNTFGWFMVNNSEQYVFAGNSASAQAIGQYLHAAGVSSVVN